MKKKIALLLIIDTILILSTPRAMAIVNEVAFDFGYDRTKYGTNRQNSQVNRSYSGGLSTYIFDYTAIDLNASRSEDIITEYVANSANAISSQSRVTSYVYGIGLKQMFASRKARLIPGISVGYAKQFQNYQSDYTIDYLATGQRVFITSGKTKDRSDSMFGTFSLQLKMTETFSLKGSIRTLFPAGEFNKARDSVKYTIGFSWIF